MATTTIDAKFAALGAEPGVWVWRVNAFEIEEVAASEHGRFFAGDAYIVLQSARLSAATRALRHDVFFWLGDECSQDESGTAAIKTVELDNHLGGAAEQHREVMGHETAQFVAVFGGLTYLKGGHASGFRSVAATSDRLHKLFHLKGRRTVRAREVPIAAGSLNSGDVFVLAHQPDLFVWRGASASRMEALQGMMFATQLRDNEMHSRAQIVALDEGQESDAFWAALGGKGAVQSAEAGGDDAEFEASAKRTLQLLRYADGAFAPLASTPLDASMLASNSMCLLDGLSTVYVWRGSKLDRGTAALALRAGQDYLERTNRARSVPLSCIGEFGEPSMFVSAFARWRSAAPVTLPASFSASSATSAAQAPAPLDVAALHRVAPRAAFVAPWDAGTLHVRAWRVENFELAPVPDAAVGQFHAGDSYVVLAEFLVHNRNNALAFAWQGRASSQDERGASARHMVTIAGDARASQTQVTQGHEPDVFLALFGGAMIVHSGGVASGWRNVHDADSFDRDGTYLYHVSGRAAATLQAVQVDERALSLNSNDAFALVTPAGAFAWRGRFANDREAAFAMDVASKLGRGSATAIAEGSEPDAFWAALGGKQPYATTQRPDDDERPCLLFRVSCNSGALKVTPVPDFTQADLDDDDVMMLDAYHQVFLWIGAESSVQERTEAPKVARQYVATAVDGRSADTPINVVESGREPVTFTSCFVGWDFGRKSSGEVYAATMQALSAYSEELAAATAVPDVMPYERLRSKTCPELGIAFGTKEKYLSAAEFEQVLGMTRDAFYKLAPWRQVDLKKRNGLV